MAFNEHCAELMREALADLEGITEKKMFGGLCFLLHGNMLCGVDKNGGMARVGKDNEAAALEWKGVDPLSFTGRKMGGFVELTEEAVENEELLQDVIALALDYVSPLPPK